MIWADCPSCSTLRASNMPNLDMISVSESGPWGRSFNISLNFDVYMYYIDLVGGTNYRDATESLFSADASHQLIQVFW